MTVQVRKIVGNLIIASHALHGEANPDKRRQCYLKIPVIASPARQDEANPDKRCEKILKTENRINMRHLIPILTLAILLASSCTSSRKLSYLNNLPETGGEEYFTMEIPDYKIQPRDILYITVKAMTPEGMITDFLSSGRSTGGSYYMQNEAGQYLYGFDVNPEGNVILPVLGAVHVTGSTLEENRKLLQEKFSASFKDAIVECKLLSFKFTVIGEVRSPGTFVNYNNYLTVLEAIGRAGGIGDYGRKDRVLVLRPEEKGTKAYNISLQDKSLLSSPGYFLLPNDVVIVEPQKNKIFNLNLPAITFILTSLTSTITMLILILNFTKGN